MPELPEVEVVRAGLEHAVKGATVTRVEVLDERSLRRHAGGVDDFVGTLTGRTLLAAVRRGKFLWFPLEDSLPGAAGEMALTVLGGGPNEPASPLALVAHLGMSGQVLLRDHSADDLRTRIRIDLDHPVLGPSRLNFVDQRIFGSMAVDRLVPTPDGLPGGFAGSPPAAGLAVPTAAASTVMASTAAASAALVPTRVAHIARDPLDAAFDDRVFLAALARRRTGIKRALLDQTLVSGIGNIYADESLWAARVHFDERTDLLSRRRASVLLAEVRAVLRRALADGGTSFDTQYVNVNGASGSFSRSLNVYGRQGLPCPRCGRPIVRVAFMNRSSHFCAFCQRVRSSASV